MKIAALFFFLAVRTSAAQVDTARQIAVGSSVTGHLAKHDARTADGTYAQAWHLKGTPGHLVTVDLASKDFDAFLMARGAGLDSASGPLQDDDSGGHCNARLTLRIPASGECTIVVTTSSRNATGHFILAVRSGAVPASLAPCHG
ncbi:MAG TPA: hypothetical protein VH113_04830 [Gemmatimonadales bacterium]|jgi:hypothetical protein|nr:hypothetical protein [Gemmatimonadales bacterium]